jgi:hypothetical protein
MNDKERQARVRDLWLERPAEQRTGNGVRAFYGYLEKNHPELLKRGHGDRYQQLKADLRGLILEP